MNHSLAQFSGAIAITPHHLQITRQIRPRFPAYHRRGLIEKPHSDIMQVRIEQRIFPGQGQPFRVSAHRLPGRAAKGDIAGGRTAIGAGRHPVRGSSAIPFDSFLKRIADDRRTPAAHHTDVRIFLKRPDDFLEPFLFRNRTGVQRDNDLGARIPDRQVSAFGDIAALFQNHAATVPPYGPSSRRRRSRTHPAAGSTSSEPRSSPTRKLPRYKRSKSTPLSWPSPGSNAESPGARAGFALTHKAERYY
jgi:hypothetical protein